MTTPPEQIEVHCQQCGTTFQTWHRASMNLVNDKFSRAYIKRMSTAQCPTCGQKIDLGSLVVGADHVWRFTPDGVPTRGKRRTRPQARSREQLAEDLSIVLMSTVSEGGKRAFISSTLWSWSEHAGKYTTRYYSQSVAKNKPTDKLILRHDHAVPRNMLEDRLMALPDHSPDSIYAFLDRYCLGVTIAKADDDKLNKQGFRSKMPKGWDWGDPLARYSASGIVVEDRGRA